MIEKKCPYCHTQLNRDKDGKVAGLINVDKKDDNIISVDPTNVIPVRPLICKTCSYLELELAQDFIG